MARAYPFPAMICCAELLPIHSSLRPDSLLHPESPWQCEVFQGKVLACPCTVLPTISAPIASDKVPRPPLESIDLATSNARLMTVFSVSSSDAGDCMIDKYPTVVFSGLIVLAF